MKQTTAAHAIRFIENLTLTDDSQGEPFILQPWQKNFLRKFYDSKIRECFLFIPRKSSKTIMAAATCLVELYGPPGRTIILAASDRAQADHVFEKCVTMILADPYLSSLVNIKDSKKQIIHKGTRNKLLIVSEDGRRAHGYNPSMVVIDEVHALAGKKHEELFRTLTSGFGTRKNYKLLYITTAGESKNSICGREYEYACKVRDGIVEDDTYLPVIYEAPLEDDWREESTWRKAMPGLGKTPLIDVIRKEVRKAKVMPTEERKFRRLYLNQWIGSDAKFVSPELWASCKESFSLDDIAGLDAFIGADIGMVDDLTSVVVAALKDDKIYIIPYFWTSEAHADREQDRYDYLSWAEDKYITICPGEVIPTHTVTEKVKELSKIVNIKNVILDPYSANHVSLELRDREGMPVHHLIQGSLSLSYPTKYLDYSLRTGLLRHDGNPVMAWNVDNARVRESDGELWKLVKGPKSEKIDGVAALVNALSVAMYTPIGSDFWSNPDAYLIDLNEKPQEDN